MSTKNTTSTVPEELSGPKTLHPLGAGPAGPELIEDSHEYAEALASVPTAAFFADSRASTIQLGQTVSLLLSVHGIKRGIVEVTSAAGRVVAREFHRAGLPYDVFDLDTEANDLYLLEQATGTVEIEIAAVAALDAELIVLPAMVGSGQGRVDVFIDPGATLDLTVQTLPGRIIEAAEAAHRELLLIDTPENGLVQRAGGEYHRRIFRVQTEI